MLFNFLCQTEYWMHIIKIWITILFPACTAALQHWSCCLKITQIMLFLVSLKLTRKNAAANDGDIKRQHISANCICTSVDHVQVIRCFWNGTDRPPMIIYQFFLFKFFYVIWRSLQILKSFFLFFLFLWFVLSFTVWPAISP